MTKDELRNIRQYKLLLDVIEEDIRQQKQSLMEVHAVDYSKEKLSGGMEKVQEQLLCKLMDEEKDLLKKKQDLIDQQRVIKGLIAKLNTKEQQAVMYRYYILGYKWSEIAEDMNYSESQIFYFHKKALEKMKRLN